MLHCLARCASSVLIHPPRSSSMASPLEKFASEHHRGIANVVLKCGKSKTLRDGSPMIYSGSVDRMIGIVPPKTGDVVVVSDGSEKPIGWGLYNSVSMYRVRLMQLEDEVARDPSCSMDMVKLLERRIEDAVNLRRKLKLPSCYTNAYRLINSEGDRLSGLIVDVFGDLAVIASSAAWVEIYKPQIVACISRIDQLNHIKWRPSIEILEKDGMVVEDPEEASIHPLEKIKIIENGLSYEVSLDGQKTGFYTDQRENRMLLSTISEGQNVLDMFCYSGGFSLNASHGGASRVTGVDTSLSALDLANENIILNNLDPGIISFLRKDATMFMKEAISRNDVWDIIILDPPKYAPRREVLRSAMRMYKKLNYLAMLITKPGGFLMTCSCSGAVTQSGMFMRILQDAGSKAGRKITVLRETGAASDHPIDPSYPHGAYLSNVLLRVL